MAVSPGGVLQRLLADRRPEPGHLVPVTVLLRQRAARDLPMPDGVSPMLDAEMPVGRGVVGVGDVADRKHDARAVHAAHRLVDDHGSVARREAGLGCELTARAHACAEYDAGAADAPAVFQHDLASVVDRGHLCVAQQFDAEIAQPTGDLLGGLGPEALQLGKTLLADQRHGDVKVRKRAGDLAADEPGADDDHTLAGLDPLGQALAVGESPDRQHQRMPSARNPRSHGLRAGGENDGIGTQLAIGEGHGAALRIDRARPPPEAQLHLMLVEPGFRFDRELRYVHFAAQEGLGQRRTLIGQARLDADERHGAVAAATPVCPRRGKAGGTGSHDDDPFSRHLAGQDRSRRYGRH